MVSGTGVPAATSAQAGDYAQGQVLRTVYGATGPITQSNVARAGKLITSIATNRSVKTSCDIRPGGITKTDVVITRNT